MLKKITKNFLRKGAVAIASAFVVFCVFIPVTEASVAPFINYQGKLTNTSGWAVADGSYDMRFKIYDAVTNGNLLWTGTHTTANGNAVDLSRGIFSLLFGSGTGNAMIDLNADTYYLQVEIYNTDTSDWEIFNNRKRLGSVPQALNAKNIVSDGFINIDNTSTSQDLLNISYNPASGAFNAASIIYGSGGGTGTALSITQEGAGNAFQVNDVSGDTTPFVIDASGKVGIGTTTPGQTLTVAGTLGILETGDTPLYHTIFQGGDQGADITYTLPTSNTSGIMRNDAGVLSWTNVQTLPTHAGIDELNEITSNGDGTANVPANTASFLDDTQMTISRVAIVANAALALTNNAANYVVADRDTLTWVVLSSEDSIDYVRYLPYAEIYRSGNNLHVQLSPLFGNTQVSQEFHRFADTERYAREDGLDSIAVDGSLHITVNGGVVWATFNRFVVVPVTTATTWFNAHHESSAWVNTYNANNPVINNTQYDPGTNLATLDDGYWTINYIYRGVEASEQDHLYRVLGNAQYATLEEAKASNSLAALPELINSHAMLMGRIIVQKGTTSNYTIESAFDTVYAGASSITSHSALTGLLNDDHTQYALLTGRSGGQTITGGTVANNALTIRGNNTTGNTATNANLVFKVGESAGTTAMTILNNGKIGIGTTPDAYLHVLGATEQLRLGYDAGNYASFTTASDSKMTLETSSSIQSMITIGKGVAQNAGISLDGNTNDYYVGMDDATDKFMIGFGQVIGTTPYLTMDASGNFDLSGTLTVGSGNIALTDATGKIQHDSIVDCADTQILKWATVGGWACATDATGSSLPIGTEGQMLYNNAGSWSTLSAGMIWDDVNQRLGLGVATPDAYLHVLGATEQLRLGYDAGNYASFTTASDSKMTLETSSSIQSMITIGKGVAQNAGISLDGNTNDYYVGMDDATDKFMIGFGQVIGTTPYLTMDASGNFGIGTTSPSAQLHTTGTVRFENFGSGTMQTDANGNVTVSSDERLKNISGEYTRGLESIMKINPIVFHWNEQSGLETEHPNAGFSAQNVQMSIPEAVGVDPRGFLTLTDRSILAVVVNSIKEQQGEILQMEALNTDITNGSLVLSERITKVEDVVKKLELQGLTLETQMNETTTLVSHQQASITEIESQLASLTQNQVVPVPADLKVSDQETALSASSIPIISEVKPVVMNLGQMESDGVLVIKTPIEFHGPAVFKVIAEFIDTVIFRNNVEFIGQVLYNQDTAGYAIVKDGQDKVTITFEKEYTDIPIVNASLSLQNIENAEVRQAAEELLLVSDVKFIITNVTQKGFEIKINQKALSEIPFSWQAILVKNPKTFSQKIADKSSTQETIDVNTESSIGTLPIIDEKNSSTSTEAEASVNAVEPVVEAVPLVKETQEVPISQGDFSSGNENVPNGV